MQMGINNKNTFGPAFIRLIFSTVGSLQPLSWLPKKENKKCAYCQMQATPVHVHVCHGQFILSNLNLCSNEELGT